LVYLLYWYNSTNPDADEGRGAAVYASISDYNADLRSTPPKVLRSDADEGRGAAVYASISTAIDALMTVCLKAALSQLAEERQVLTYAHVCSRMLTYAGALPARRGAAGTQFTCFTGTRVHILTRLRRCVVAARLLTYADVC